MGVWFGDTYYTFPDKVTVQGREFVFHSIENGKPWYVYEGENLKVLLMENNKMVLQTKNEKSLKTIKDLNNFEKLDKFFGTINVYNAVLDSGFTFQRGDSIYYANIYYGDLSIILESDVGIVEVTALFEQLPEVFGDPLNFEHKVLLRIPGKYIKKIQSSINETRIFFKNGAYVTRKKDGKFYFFHEITEKEAAEVGMSDDFIVIEGLVEKVRADNRSTYRGDLVELTKRLVELGSKQRVAGPLVAVDGRVVETARGHVIMKSNNPVVDDEIYRALGYLYGINDNFDSYLAVTLDEKKSKIVKRNRETGVNLFKLGGKIFWVLDEGKITNGKYIVSRGIKTDKNRIPLSLPVKKQVLDKIRRGEDVYPSDVFPGLPRVCRVESNNGFVIIQAGKKSILTKIVIGKDGVKYTSVPYITGVAKVFVPWREEVDVITPPEVDPKYIENHVTLAVNNLLEDFKSITQLGTRAVVISYKWGDIVITDRYVEVNYKGKKRRFNDPPILTSEEELEAIMYIA